jgi:hypothetical protein
VDFFSFSCREFQKGEGDKAKRDANGQAVGKGNEDKSQKGGEGFLWVFPIDLREGQNHKGAHEHQGDGTCNGWNKRE